MDISVFGATGDLVTRKIMPALQALFIANLLPNNFSITAFSRRPWGDKEYREFLGDYSPEFLSHINYVYGQFQDPASYKKLAKKVSSRLFYFAVQPEFYSDILKGLDSAKLLSGAKLLVEKPFGFDARSASNLEKKFESVVSREQIFHVDHYLAKEGLKNVVDMKKTDLKSLTFQIFEKIGIEGRGEFYDSVGAVRDVAQNHLLQMVAITLADAQAPDKNKARADALTSLSITGTPVFGQYEGYQQEKDVPKNSQTETYVKFALASSLPNWSDVEIVCETGKAMSEKKACINFLYKDGSEKFVDVQRSDSGKDAYETVIEQAILGNHAYFASIDEIVAGWNIVLPLLKNRGILKIYKQNSLMI